MLRFHCTCRVHLTYSLCINPWPPPPPPTSLHVLFWPSIVRRARVGASAMATSWAATGGTGSQTHTPATRFPSLASLPPQKFRFCGERDCPDWLLAEIVLLTKMVRECGWLRLCECASSVTDERRGTAGGVHFVWPCGYLCEPFRRRPFHRCESAVILEQRTPTRHLRATLLIVRSGAIGSLACFMDKDA